MDFHAIKVEKTNDGIGVITLNRPDKRNALSIQMRREISACLEIWRDSPEISIVIFTGAGSVFSAGFDLSEFGQLDLHNEILRSSSRYHMDVWNFPKPTVVAVNGPAIGGGVDLATLCDIRICSSSAVFGHPEIKFGAPPLFTPLRWIVGDGIARDLCLTGRKIDSREALRIGLVSQIVESDTLLDSALQIARTVKEAPSEALQFMKGYFISSCGKGFEESFRVEHDETFKKILLRNAYDSLKQSSRDG